MKSYSLSELSGIIEGVKKESDELNKELSELKEKRKIIKFIDFKSKGIIDQKIEVLNDLITCNNYLLIMLCLYEDSLRPDYTPMSNEKLIRCEIESESGDGISKLIIFCHKCFVEHTIVDRDIKKLEIEAKEGVLSSLYILMGYNFLFADN